VSLLFVAVLLLGSPFTRDGARRVLSRRADRAAPVTRAEPPCALSEPLRPLPADPEFTVPDQMALADLCQAWRSSYVALERATSPDSLLRVVHADVGDLPRRARTPGRAGHAGLAALGRGGRR
jgi:hypothetical protein